MNVLFICSRNQWRSPTAEQVWRYHPDLSVKSAGTSRNARKPVTPALLQWADAICVMEQKHKNRLVAEYHRLLEHKTIHVLDIADDYQYMDPQLVELLKDVVAHRLGLAI
ncbi:phosphotyrosine protein phosphatase [Pragia fontium]|uniref:Phosphotyrosine protein phosphatase n=1 Tax=Pragia fontium TaxID=82985 RepID=A0ABQ5LGY5_9GAMM|nr:phosphotyrosine protein phosphatase [Pragia fontium]GKX62247.1 phosphotyrosine protein phosphatase [Pragia fontium]